MTVTETEPKTTRPNLLVRSVLTSVAFLLLALPALSVAGGYFVRLPAIGGYGRFLMTDLPWLAVAAAIALALALLAVRLGGRGFTAALAVVSLVVLGGVVGAGIQFEALAASHGGPYDVLRQARTPAPVGRGPDARIVFAEVDGQPLHAEIWRARSGSAAATTAGAGVLFIHGGGFKDGGPGLRPYLFAGLAAAGYTVADIEYRLVPPPRWQDAPADVLCALGWFQRDAATYGVDPDRIFVMGESAGGNLALIAAYGPGYGSAHGGFTPSCQVSPAPPQGVIAVSPTADLVVTWADVRLLADETPFPERYTGGPPTMFPERYEAASVGRLIRPGLPRTLILAGTNDQLVRIEPMRDLTANLRAAGTDVELVEVPFADHAFDGSPNGFGAQLEEILYDQFLSTRRE